MIEKIFKQYIKMNKKGNIINFEFLGEEKQ